MNTEETEQWASKGCIQLETIRNWKQNVITLTSWVLRVLILCSIFYVSFSNRQVFEALKHKIQVEPCKEDLMLTKHKKINNKETRKHTFYDYPQNCMRL